MKKIGLYFGSFNPIHNGHLMIANFVTEYCNIDELWFVVSPQNPFKDKKDLLDAQERLKLIELSIEGYKKFKTCDIEFSLTQPSYTINTLEKLSTLYPDYRFTMICGMDSLKDLPRWKRSQDILDHYPILVYPRKGYDDEGELLKLPDVCLVNAPEIEISSTVIRNATKNNKILRYYMREKAYDYMVKNNFYKI